MAQEYSDLWGENGDDWDPTGLSRDFTSVGYAQVNTEDADFVNIAYFLLGANRNAAAFLQGDIADVLIYDYVSWDNTKQTETYMAGPGQNTPPSIASSSNLMVTVSLDWADNTEDNLSGYLVYRSTTSGVFDGVSPISVTESEHIDNTVKIGITYYYVVRAINTDGNISPQSNQVSVTPAAPNKLPTISFITPTAGAIVSASTNLYVHVNASDPDGSVDNVQLFLDGEFVRQENKVEYEWGAPGQNDTEIQNLLPGIYELQVVATDNPGSTNTDTIQITVSSDADDDSIDDNWEILYFGSVGVIDGNGDSDGDGVADFFEYLYGSNPNNATSRGFAFHARHGQNGSNFIYDWGVVEGFSLGEDYEVWISTNLSSWAPLAEGDYSLSMTTEDGYTHMELKLEDNDGSIVFLRLHKAELQSP